MSGQRGSAAIELVAGTALLILPTVLLVLSLPGWAQAHTMARVAAREAARTVVLAEDPSGADAAAAGRRAAATVAANHGRELVAGPSYAWSEAEVAGGDGSVRQPRLSATVTVRVPAIVVPLVGEWAGFGWSVTHTEPLDVYRSR